MEINDDINNAKYEHNVVKNPIWQEADQLAFNSAAEEFNSGLPRTTWTPAGGHLRSVENWRKTSLSVPVC